MTKKFPLTKKEKERKVVELYEKGKNIRDISKRVRMSFSDISQITRKHSGDEYSIEKSKKYSKHSQALELFRRGESNLGVAINLGLTDFETIEEHKQYRRLIDNDKFCELYDRNEGELESLLLLYDELRNANLSARDAIEGVTYARKLNSMKLECNALQNDAQRLKHENSYRWNLLQSLKQDINSASSELQVMNEGKDAVLNEIDAARQRSQEVLPPMRIRRRRIRHQHPFVPFGKSDLFPEQ